MTNPWLCLCCISILQINKQTLIGNPSIQKFGFYLGHVNKLSTDSLLTFIFMAFHVSRYTPLVQLFHKHFYHKWLENIRTITALGRKIPSFKVLCVCVEEWDWEYILRMWVKVHKYDISITRSGAFCEVLSFNCPLDPLHFKLEIWKFPNWTPYHLPCVVVDWIQLVIIRMLHVESTLRFLIHSQLIF